jgi:hypothetical protein
VGIERLQAGLDEAYRLQIRNINQQLGLEVVGIDLIAGQAGRPPSAPDR